MKYGNSIKYLITGSLFSGPPRLVIEEPLFCQELQRQREVKKAE